MKGFGVGKIVQVVLATVVCVGLWSCRAEAKSEPAVESKVAVDTFMGDWRGTYETDTDAGDFVAQVIALGDGAYRMNILTEFDTGEDPIHVMDGVLKDGKFTYTADGGEYKGDGVLEPGMFKCRYEGPVNGRIEMHPVKRLSPMLGAKPPKGAVVLFDGTSLDEWERIGGSVGVIDLAHLIGGDNAAAYMSSGIWSDKEQDAVLELGSDDGIKVWFNEKVVHVNDVARGVKAGEDKVNIRLKKGWNQLLLKITNGGGGWGACARIVDSNGKPLKNIGEATQTSPDGGSRRYLKENGGFLTSWMITGPYRLEGKGPSELIDAKMGPELKGKECKWMAVWPKGDAKEPRWKLVDGAMEIRDGSIKTKKVFKNFKLHVEFKTPFMPKARGQGRGNSGVYLQNRYEVQVLDSYGLAGLDNECGGIYKVGRPRVNMCAPPEQWQSYDMTFRAAVYDNEGKKTDKARLTVRHNGVIIHDDIEIGGPTGGALDNREFEPGGVYLQDHGNPVQYRNIWLMELK